MKSLNTQLIIENQNNFLKEKLLRRKGNIQIKNKISLINNIMFFKLLMLMHLIQMLITNKSLFIELYFSKITLKIKGIGEKTLLGNGYFQNQSQFFNSTFYPDQIIINGIQQNIINYSYYFNLTENYVELIWNKEINNAKNMFRSCSDIIEFNFSNFDTSLITNMMGMFCGCNSLISLDLSYFNTSNVVDMSSMFQYCGSLISINLSGFDTSKVTSIFCMFQYCSSLNSINLSNFDTLKLKSIHHLFSNCSNLEYINMKNFNDINLTAGYHSSNIFNNIPINVVICINEDNNQNQIIPQIKKIKCYTYDCSDDWKSKRKKVVYNIDICLDSCDNDTKYFYEYNGICYEIVQMVFIMMIMVQKNVNVN